MYDSIVFYLKTGTRPYLYNDSTDILRCFEAILNSLNFCVKQQFNFKTQVCVGCTSCMFASAVNDTKIIILIATIQIIQSELCNLSMLCHLLYTKLRFSYFIGCFNTSRSDTIRFDSIPDEGPLIMEFYSTFTYTDDITVLLYSSEFSSYIYICFLY